MSWLTKEGWVYFVGEPTGGTPVKIGWTTNAESRLQDIRVACPLDLEILAAIRGTPNDERRLHDALDHLRIRGEWFHHRGVLTGLLKHLRSDWVVLFDTTLNWAMERERWGGKQPQRRKRWTYIPTPEVLRAAGIE